ncbi:MAG: hypothetical protein K9M45_01780 [Kiritimatiellales bacterium]|nr:hypothetical protein [Kiritimatiellales bacterium]
MRTNGKLNVWMSVGFLVAMGVLAEPFSIVSMTLHDEALSGAHDVALSGNLAFVPGKGQSLSIIDISNPAKPEILWFKNGEEIPDSETVLPVGDHLLLGTRDFLSLDVKDPRNPFILKTISDRPRIDSINGMVKLDDYVFAACKSGYIDAFDISDMKNPTLFGTLETHKRFDFVKPHDIDRYGDHLVIVDPAGFTPPVGRMGVIKVLGNGKLLPVDQWKLVGMAEAQELIGANRVQVKGHYAIIGGSFSVKARLTAGPGTANMVVVDISDPAIPKIVAALPVSDVRGPNGLTIAGNVVFCAGGQSIDAYDITNPAKPVHLAGQSFPRYNKDAKKTDNYHDLIYRDGYLYVSAQTDNGLLILKVNGEGIRKRAEEKQGNPCVR